MVSLPAKGLVHFLNKMRSDSSLWSGLTNHAVHAPPSSEGHLFPSDILPPASVLTVLFRLDSSLALAHCWPWLSSPAGWAFIKANVLGPLEELKSFRRSTQQAGKGPVQGQTSCHCIAPNRKGWVCTLLRLSRGEPGSQDRDRMWEGQNSSH